MKCRYIHKKLIFYLEGTLSKKEMEEVASHLDQCTLCAAFASDMKKTLAIIPMERQPEVNPYFYTRVKARLESHSEQPYGSYQPVFRRIVQAALLSVILVTGIYSGYRIGENMGEINQVKKNSVALFPYLDEMDDEPIEMFLIE